MKKIFAMILAGIMSAVMLCGCGDSGENVQVDEGKAAQAGKELSAGTAVEYTAGRVLPDPGQYLSVLGSLYEENYEIDGDVYDIYYYEFQKAEGSALDLTVTAYSWGVQAAGFEWTALTELSEDGERWFAASSEDGDAFLIVYGSSFTSDCTAELYVPEGMAFTLATSLSTGDTFQNEIYVDKDEVMTPDGGAAQTVTCAYCHGRKTCPDCNGTLTWRNPYTGDEVQCRCGNGKCPVCDGTGVWGG